MNSKVCSACAESKPLVDFFRNKSGAESRRSRCKSCTQAKRFFSFCCDCKQAKGRNKSPRCSGCQMKIQPAATRSVYHREYRDKNKAKLKQARKQYVATNKDRVRAIEKSWRARNKDRNALLARKWWYRQSYLGHSNLVKTAELLYQLRRRIDDQPKRQ